MVRLARQSILGDDDLPKWRPTCRVHLEDGMIGRLGRYRDPFEGRGAHRRALRLRMEGIVALSLAIAACGLTMAVWIKTLVPLFSALLI